MSRTKKPGRRGAGVPGVTTPPVIGGITPGSTRRPSGTSRGSEGRLGRAIAAKASAPRARSKPATAKVPKRKEKVGRRPPKPTSANAAAPKRPVKNAKGKTKGLAVRDPVPPDRASQRKAKARVKGSQIKRAGLESRLLGHVSSSGKRHQARRDSKNG